MYIQNYVKKTFAGSAQTVKKIRVNFLPQKFPMYTHAYGMSRTIVTPYLTGLFLDKSKGLTDLLEAAKIYKQLLHVHLYMYNMQYICVCIWIIIQ